MAVDSKPEAIDELDRRIIQLKIEREALKRESDQASRDPPGRPGARAVRPGAGVGRADRQVAGREGPSSRARRRSRRIWRRPAPSWRPRSATAIGAGRASWPTASSPAWRRRFGMQRSNASSRMLNEEVRDSDIAGGGQPLDRRAGRQDAGRRAREAAGDGGQAARPGHRPGRGHRRGVQCRAPGAAPACRIPTARSAPSCSWGRPASARPS